MTGTICIAGLSHEYTGRGESSTTRALEDVCFSVDGGQFVSIIGPSGCGKTTLLNIMTGLAPALNGSVTLAGSPPNAGRRDVARMFARDALLPWLTAAQNVDFALRTRIPDPLERERAIRALLRDVGLDGFENSNPRRLSQGMRQRVALARTFGLPSKFIFLDEPFGALDAQTKLILQDELLRLWSHRSSTIVLVTHDLGEAVALSDRVLVMAARPGRIIADVAVDLPRPRSVRELQHEQAYHDLYSRLWLELEHSGSAAAVTDGA